MRAILLAGILLPLTVAAAHADGDPVKGRMQFGPCSSCHLTQESDETKIGPNLHNVFGRKAGTRPEYMYSDAVRASGVIWSEDTLRKWIKKPTDFIPGTKMPFPGYDKEDWVENVIAYLKDATK
jgi:cytochrome c